MRTTQLLASLVVVATAVFTACGGGDDATETAIPDAVLTGTATGTATAVEPSGDTPSPAPEVGTEAPLAAQSVAEADGVRVVLLQVTEDWPAPDGEPAAPPGSHYVQIAVTLENHGTETLSVGYDSFVFNSSGGVSDGIKIGGAEPYLGKQDLPAEAAVQGFVVGVVADGESLVGISFDADVSTSAAILFGEAGPEDEETPTATEPEETPTEDEGTPSGT